MRTNGAMASLVEVLVTNHVGGVPKDGGALNAAQSRGAHSTAADPGAVDATLSFAGCAKVPTKVELRRVDFDHANALSVWYGPLQAVAYLAAAPRLPPP